MSKDIYHELNDLAEAYAKAEAERVYLAEFRKCKKALLMKEAEAKNPNLKVNSQERNAYAHPEYKELLKGLQVATENALAAKWKLETIKMQFDSWRTKESTKRAEMQHIK